MANNFNEEKYSEIIEFINLKKAVIKFGYEQVRRTLNRFVAQENEKRRLAKEIKSKESELERLKAKI